MFACRNLNKCRFISLKYPKSNQSINMLLHRCILTSNKRDANAVIESTAFVDPTANVGLDTYIGHFVHIGPDVNIGDGCKIYSHCTITNCDVGKRVILNSGIRIGQVSI